MSGAPGVTSADRLRPTRARGSGSRGRSDPSLWGTLTGAHPVAPGQRWTLAIGGAPLRGLDLRLR